MISAEGIATQVPSTFGGVQILPIADAATSMGMFMGIYGSGGVGKTTIVGEVARKYGPLLYVDAEGGGKSIKHIPNVHIAQITKWSEAANLCRDLQKPGHPFKAIVYDNMSELQSLCINSIAGNNPVQIQHWGECTARMLKLTRDLREISRTQGVHVFMMAWDSIEQAESGVVTKRGVGFTPSLARQFPGIVTYIGYLTPLDGYPSIRKLSFMVSTKTDAKFRVSPAENAATIPLELYIRKGSNVLADIIATESENEKFPFQKYGEPQQSEKGK